LQLHEIIYLEALKDYTGIITNKKKVLRAHAARQPAQRKSFPDFYTDTPQLCHTKTFYKRNICPGGNGK